MKRRRSIERGMIRFFVGMKRLTNVSTDELRSGLRHWLELGLPSKATLNNACRDYGLDAQPPTLRLVKNRPLGQVRMQVFKGSFYDRHDAPNELAISYETWSGAIYARLSSTFAGYEETSRFLRDSLTAFPPEYRNLVRTVVLLHRDPVIETPFAALVAKSAQSGTLADQAEYDATNLGLYAPCYIGEYKIWPGGSDYEGVRNFLPRIVGSYNCHDPVTSAHRYRGKPRWRESFEGFSGLEVPGQRVGRVAELGQEVEGRGPARRVFAALSSIRRVEPRDQTTNVKYTMEHIKKYLRPTTPSRGRWKNRKITPA